MNSLKADNISVTLSKTPILKDVTLEINKGDFVGVIGPNGSGKSTLLKTIYRTLEPSKGAIFIDGTSIDTLPYKSSAKKMSVVGQHNDHAFDFNVYDLVMMGRSPYKGFMESDSAKDHKIVMEALDKVSMTTYVGRDYSTLSGGEKQRVILARALAQESALMILDEPTNHLDVRHQIELMSVVKSLDTTVLFAVHDLNIALMYCNKICVLKDGSVEAIGNPKELITPKTIKDIYEVSAEVLELKDGRLHVVYDAIL